MPTKGRPIKIAGGGGALIAAAGTIGFVAGLLVVLIINARASDYRASFPPKQYDHPFPGKMVIHRLSSAGATSACARFGYAADGCAWMDTRRHVCHVVLSTDRPPDVQATVIVHERGHCNGWPADHAGAR